MNFLGSLEGHLTATLGGGALKANIARTDGIKVQSMNGKVAIGFHDEVKADVRVEAAEVNMQDLDVNHDRHLTGGYPSRKLIGIKGSVLRL